MPYFCSLVYKDIFAAVHHQSVAFFNEEMAGKVALRDGRHKTSGYIRTS